MELVRDRHVKFFNRCLKILPSSFEELFDRKPLVAFFCLSGLEILDQVPEEKSSFIDWLYSMQFLDAETDTAGFLGGFSIADSNITEPHIFDVPVLGMTYTSLCSLLILGDDLSRVHRKQILNDIKRLQLEDGSFYSQFLDGETDLRLVYCAVSICYILDDFSTIDVDACVRFIKSCLTYEGAVACLPGAEAHGGSSFCAVASLALLGRLEEIRDNRADLVRWCLNRQESGFNGRPNKRVDTCYSFWVGGTLRILDSFQFADGAMIRDFVCQAQSVITGGFGKWSDASPDPMHSYLALAGLSFIGKDKLQELFVPLNVTVRTHERLKKIHDAWETA
ncbi:geranylgeranyl transferase type-1 subunit beta [Galendromus occidentalis]|uniref:Geranylgeranyl transferase type-1 subunit beta n=1 Tax=Galendromus occidentalis TaxID=34638 RepID=A0AAJ7SFI7_9ACAR|nr:geranylgeranyl transferase type-1 subunit beta [Galendromus occidentalis]